MEFDIKAIENKLNTISTKDEKLNYLNDYLFKLKKKQSEFISFDKKELDRLMIKTSDDYEKYMNEFDNGRLVYWSNSKWDKKTAERLGIKNVELLKTRIRLEFKFNNLLGKIKLFESLFDKVTKETITPQQIEIKTEQLIPEIKPTFKAEEVQTVFNLLKDFFSPEHQPQLLEILSNGGVVSKHLIFKDYGTRLANGFKKLIEHDFITGCQKQNLEKWIINNFKYTYRNQIKMFTPDYIEKCISRNYYPCKNPLFEIVNDKIQKTDQPHKKKYNNY